MSQKVEIKKSVREIKKTDWDRLANPKNKPYNPFLKWDFFDALEQSESATVRQGWMPQHLMLTDDGGEVTGVMPCYLKNHSQGEYVFDYGWADAFEQAGGRYYPKLQCSVPFTPVTGARMFAEPQNKKILAQALKQFCTKLNVSSAHVTFVEEEEVEGLNEAGFISRTDQQFHFINNNYKNFGDFLDGLSARKRKNIKKERNAIPKDVSIEWITAKNISEEILDAFFGFYIDTGNRKWGNPYLTRQFFGCVTETMQDDMLFVMAKKNQKYIAGALNFIGSDTLFGRYWGAVEHIPCLHFEICYYQAMEYAIKNNLNKVEAGAQGSHKLARGYMPQTTHSAHFITHQGLRNAVEEYLGFEKQEVEFQNHILSKHSPFKKNKENTNDAIR